MTRGGLILALVALSGCLDGRGGEMRRSGQGSLPEGVAEFAQLVDQLSGPGGYFDTDNLISNESSYLHVVGGLEAMGLRGGAYIGVGPDQNFSYIAQIRPSIAFIVDIRRDNLLQHLMFKSLFSLAGNRIEYLCLLTGRPVPEDSDAWGERDVEVLVEYIDGRAATPQSAERAWEAVAGRVQAFGIPLSEGDLSTVRRFHGTFIREGLGLRFRSHGRGPRPYYPTYRQLILERDRGGRRSSYLATEAAFQFVRELQAEHRVVPVVGDLAGEHALNAIGRYLQGRGVPVTAFYTSNVEDYLMRQRRFGDFVRNLERLPYGENSVIIRSFFGRNLGYVHPQAVPGYYSVQLLGKIETLVNDFRADRIHSYFDLIVRNVLDLSDLDAASGQ